MIIVNAIRNEKEGDPRKGVSSIEPCAALG